MMKTKLFSALALGVFLAATLSPAQAAPAVKAKRVAVKVDPTKIAPVCPPRKLPSPN